jgi:hypothetical protein
MQKLDIHQDIIRKLDYFYETQKIPHLIFHGASGSGKRTLVHHFLDKIYGGDKQKLKSNVMTVNCSHGKGIKFIREDLKFFAKTNIQSNHGMNFKSIILLNADSLTIDAQSALRRCIELFSYNTRFFIIVENKHKLLNPILSRFCEIYVPEIVETYNDPVDPEIQRCRTVNLHTHQLDMVYKFKGIQEKEEQWFHGELAKMVGISSSSQMANLAVEFYERGISTIDILDWSDRVDHFTDEQRNNTRMYFHKIKSEFRCEKLLMLSILDFLFFRSEGFLENMLFL